MRAHRFTIEMPFFFRPRGEAGWREGRTENISRSGVLFRTEDTLDQETPIEMCFRLPLAIFGRPAARLICRGQIVRAICPGCEGAPVFLAATIRRYRLMPDSDGKGDE